MKVVISKRFKKLKKILTEIEKNDALLEYMCLEEEERKVKQI